MAQLGGREGQNAQADQVLSVWTLEYLDSEAAKSFEEIPARTTHGVGEAAVTSDEILAAIQEGK
jgi:hypothetical protein